MDAERCGVRSDVLGTRERERNGQHTFTRSKERGVTSGDPESDAKYRVSNRKAGIAWADKCAGVL